MVSTRSVRCVAAALLGAALLVAVACDPGGERATDQDYTNFQTAIANADEDGYTPYWLGRGFSAGGFQFVGPARGDFETPIDGGGVQFTYDAVVLANGGTVGLRITLYSPKAWDKAKVVQGSVPASGATVTAVTIAGADANVLEVQNPVGTLEQTRLIVNLGNTTVLAVAGRGNPITPGPDLNPLTDKQTLLDVMQNLRPYPQ